MNASLASELFEYANSMKSGYCKMWKANGIVAVVKEFAADQERVNRYVASCLEMEGFYLADCEKLGVWLSKKILEQ